MRSAYNVKVPPTRDQGSTAFRVSSRMSGETRAKAALWAYNSSRAHDGQAPLSRMPAGTTYTRIPTVKG